MCPFTGARAEMREPRAALPRSFPGHDGSWSLPTKPRPRDGPSESRGVEFFFLGDLVPSGQRSTAAGRGRRRAQGHPERVPALRAAPRGDPGSGRRRCSEHRAWEPPATLPRSCPLHLRHFTSHTPQPRPPPAVFLSSKTHHRREKKIYGKNKACSLDVINSAA